MTNFYFRKIVTIQPFDNVKGYRIKKKIYKILCLVNNKFTIFCSTFL